MRDAEDVKSQGLWATQAFELEQQPEALRAALRLNHRFVAAPIVIRLIQAHGLNFFAEGPAGQRLSSAIMRAMVPKRSQTRETIRKPDWSILAMSVAPRQG